MHLTLSINSTVEYAKSHKPFIVPGNKDFKYVSFSCFLAVLLVCQAKHMPPNLWSRFTPRNTFFASLSKPTGAQGILDVLGPRNIHMTCLHQDLPIGKPRCRKISTGAKLNQLGIHQWSHGKPSLWSLVPGSPARATTGSTDPSGQWCADARREPTILDLVRSRAHGSNQGSILNPGVILLWEQGWFMNQDSKLVEWEIGCQSKDNTIQHKQKRIHTALVDQSDWICTVSHHR